MEVSDNIRIGLLISLSLLLVAVAYRRFRLHVMAKHMPVRQHAELLELTVSYHPSRLRAVIAVPEPQELFPSMLGPDHQQQLAWGRFRLTKGEHVVEFPLDGQPAGEHYFKLASHSQSTVRKFLIRQG